MSFLEIRNLYAGYGGKPVLEDLSLSASAGMLIAVLGPSGTGKTTLLNAIAGFVEPSAGSIMVAGRELRGLPPNRRGCAMVFQDSALFPNMSALDNVMYGPRARGMKRSKARMKSLESLKRLQAEHLAGRKVTTLSGGEARRVALARAVIVEPDMLLLDEPFSDLDAGLLEKLRREVRLLHEKRSASLKTCSLLVTHDRADAFAVADKIAVIRKGKINASGPPKELYNRPPTRFAAEFLGWCNKWEVDVVSRRGDLIEARTPDGQVFKVATTGMTGAGERRRVTVFCRPESICAGPGPEGHSLTLNCRVSGIEYRGAYNWLDMSVFGKGIPPQKAEWQMAAAGVMRDFREVHVPERELALYPEK